MVGKGDSTVRTQRNWQGTEAIAFSRYLKGWSSCLGRLKAEIPIKGKEKLRYDCHKSAPLVQQSFHQAIGQRQINPGGCGKIRSCRCCDADAVMAASLASIDSRTSPLHSTHSKPAGIRLLRKRKFNLKGSLSSTST